MSLAQHLMHNININMFNINTITVQRNVLVFTVLLLQLVNCISINYNL